MFLIFFLGLPTRKKKENAFYLCKYLSRQLKSAIVSQTQLSKKFACPDAHTALHIEVLRSHKLTLNHKTQIVRQNQPNHFECEFLYQNTGCCCQLLNFLAKLKFELPSYSFSKSTFMNSIQHYVSHLF